MENNKMIIKEYESRILNNSELKSKAKEYNTINTEVNAFIELVCSTNEGRKNKEELDLVIKAYQLKGIDMMFWATYELIGLNYMLSRKVRESALNVLKYLNGFNLNTYYTVEMGSLTKEGRPDEYTISSSNLGFPIYMIARDSNIFEWCLNNGADLSLKLNIKEEKEKLIKAIKVTQYGNKNSIWGGEYYLRDIKKNCDGMDCKEYMNKTKRRTFIDVYNNFTKDNLVDKIEIKSFKDILAAMLSDNKEVFDRLEDYRLLINTQSFRGKNLLMYAVDKNCFEWAKKLIEGKFINPNDLNSHNQSILLYAINMKRPYMIKLIMDNQFFYKDGNQFFTSGSEIYREALYNYPKLAAKIEGHQILPIDKEWIKKGWPDASAIFESEKYIQILNKEVSAFEQNLMTLDLEDLGVKLKVANKRKI